MNHYNSKIPRIFHWKREPWAVTLGQTAYFTVAEAEVSESWHRHEDCHKKQWKEVSFFAIKYLYQIITKGYRANKFEVEARQYAESSAN